MNEKVLACLRKKNHRVFIKITSMPSVGDVVQKYIKPTGMMTICVTKSRHGIVYVLANGASITFGVNMPSRLNYYQAVVDESEEEKKDGEKDGEK